MTTFGKRTQGMGARLVDRQALGRDRPDPVDRMTQERRAALKRSLQLAGRIDRNEKNDDVLSTAVFVIAAMTIAVSGWLIFSMLSVGIHNGTPGLPMATPGAVALSADQEEQICRATIGAIMHHPPSIIRSEGRLDGIVTVHYTRPTDGTIWRQKCKIVGQQVIWGAEDGRWRAEDAIFWETADGHITIRQTHPDGTATLDRYAIRDL